MRGVFPILKIYTILNYTISDCSLFGYPVFDTIVLTKRNHIIDVN